VEQSEILITNVDNSLNQGYSQFDIDNGNNTNDQTFLLSYAESNRYLGVTYEDKNEYSRVAPTAYAIAQDAQTNTNKKTADGELAGWWLRSPGSNQYFIAEVDNGGSLDNCDIDNNNVVRPVL